MYTSISVGFSQHPDPSTAILEACVQVKNQLNAPQTDLLLVFGLPEYFVPELSAIITRTLRPKRVIGSSTGAIILPKRIAYQGIGLIGINSEDLKFGISALPAISQDIHTDGFELARNAALDLNVPQREIFITLAEGIEKNTSLFLRGARESLGIAFPIVGAMSSDDFKYQHLVQLFQDQVLHHAAVGLLLGGTFHVGLGLTHGFKPLGKPRVATRVDGNIIRTIDDKPAIDIYKHFLGGDVEHLKKMPLTSYASIYPMGFYHQAAKHYLLRNIIDILEDGSIVCHEGIPQGAEVHLMISHADACIDSAVEAAKLAKSSLADRPAKWVFVMEALSRHRLLGKTALKQIEAIEGVFGPSAVITGMASYGEIGPFGAHHNTKNLYLHNQSILIVAIA